MTAPRIFDSAALARRRARAGRIAGDRFLAREAEENLSLRIAAANRRFESVLRVDALDAVETAPGRSSTACSESVLVTRSKLASSPGALVQIRRKLKPDGLFLGALF